MFSANMKQQSFSSGSLFSPKNVKFCLFTPEELKKMSAVKIITPLALNALGHSVPGGLYDLAMGPLSSSSDPCTTCLKTSQSCPGHMGHIELPMPVINPLFHKPIAVLMKLACLKCHRLQIEPHFKWSAYGQLKLVEAGLVTLALNFEYDVEFPDQEELRSIKRDVQDVMIKKIVLDHLKATADAVCSPANEPSHAAEAVLNFIQNCVFTYSMGEKTCQYCRSKLNKITILKDRLSNKVDVAPKHQHADESMSGEPSDSSSKSQLQTLNPKEIRDHLQLIWENEQEFISEILPVLKQSSLPFPTDIFFMDIIPVPPNNVRPINFIQGKVVEHPQTAIYRRLMSDAVLLWNIIQLMQGNSLDSMSTEGKILVSAAQGSDPEEKLHYVWEELQRSADRLLDSDQYSSDAGSARFQGLRQILEKKVGVIRMNMMGKRVNFAARSVITPDPNLNVDEIGFPEAFALKLTYPVPVTPWNVKELRQMVINGPEIHPGAVLVENENGFISRLSATDSLQREAIAKRLLTPGEQTKTYGVKKVYRHLVNGDILLLNRQPTLHRPSIMAHKARILKGEKTLRMHYSNCKAYNADFDGDEMNAHFPQSELARSEAYNLVSVCHQYLVPKDGSPLGGLIQDHMVSGVRLSVRGRFFNREDYLQLVYQAVSHLPGDIRLLPPAIVKPVQMWSGKQVISTVLINSIPSGNHLINLTAKAKIPSRAWEQHSPRKWKAGGTPFMDCNLMSEAEVIIRQGELLCGVLDKTHYGATPYGLVHCVYELYGGECSSRLLSSFSKLFMAFLQLMQGFTLGVEDILVLEKADNHRTSIIQESRQVGDAAASSALGLPSNISTEILTQKMEEAYNNPKLNFRSEIDKQYKTLLNSYTDKINKVCLPVGLQKPFPSNNLQLMVQSGAKGSTVNTMQISCLLGQIELEGKRPPLMISGRSLPSFAPFDRQPRAGGFIDGRFLTGIQPQEFFFHCMAGREGLIDTAVKTSRSGYLQRCLVKSLEGLSVQYDMTVRDSDGSVIQFAYGEDGMDVSRAQFLTANQLPFLEDNKEAICDKKLSNNLKKDTPDKDIRKKHKAIRKWKLVNADDTFTRTSPFLKYSIAMRNSLVSKKIVKETGRREGVKELVDLFHDTAKTDPEMKAFYANTAKCPDPVASTFPASVNFGVLTERMESVVEDYLRRRKVKLVDEDSFKDLVFLKSMSALAPAGDPVGLLAAQSVGEPSTQMTLNTFHFAGRGEMNVTLGIPRLKEILMTASKNISTPSMEVPFFHGVKHKKAEKVKQMVTKVTLADVLENVHVNECLVLHPYPAHQYTLKFHFLPYNSFKHKFVVKPDQILQHFKKEFLNLLSFHIRKLAGSKDKLSSTDASVKGAAKRLKKGDDDSQDDFDPEQTLLSLATKTGTGEGHESSDEEAEADDEDATAARNRVRHQDTANYSDESGDEGSDVDPLREEDVDSVEGEAAPHKLHFKGFSFDKKNKEWCLVNLFLPIGMRKINLSTVIRDVAARSAIWEIPGLKRAFFVDNPKNGLLLKTDGQNLLAMSKFSHLLDLRKLYSNDIHAVAKTYGIEAAGRVIVKEIQDVFKVYGIAVDPRHLMLISDFMTSSGEFLPMSRTGMSSNPSALQKMSFESTVAFLKKALWQGKTDTLDSPSSRICIGKPCRSGTGLFQLRHQLQAL